MFQRWFLGFGMTFHFLGWTIPLRKWYFNQYFVIISKTKLTIDYFTFYVIFDSFICEIAIFTLETLESSRSQLFHIYIYIYIYIYNYYCKHYKICIRYVYFLFHFLCTFLRSRFYEIEMYFFFSFWVCVRIMRQCCLFGVYSSKILKIKMI